MPIIISHNGRDARRLDPSAFGQEADLQSYIHQNPESLPLYEIDEDLRLLVLAREFPTASGPIDALGVDQHGNLYVIETKLYRNPDKRLVLAQVLDYGAALWSSSGGSSQLLEWLERMVEQGFGKTLREKIGEFYQCEAEAVSDLISALQSNASAGIFRFVILMDRMHDRLKDLITFVNQNSRFDIYGVELEFYRFEQYEILIPKLYGAEGRKPIVGPSLPPRTAWTEQTYFEDAATRVPAAELEVMRELYSFCRERAVIAWGSGKTGSFNPKFTHLHPTVAPFSVYSDGAFYLKVSWLDKQPEAAEAGRRFGEAMRSLFGDAIPTDVMKRDCYLPRSEWMACRVEIERAIEDCFVTSS